MKKHKIDRPLSHIVDEPSGSASLAYANELRAEGESASARRSWKPRRHGGNRGMAARAKAVVEQAGAQVKDAASATQKYAQHKPYQALGIAAGIGFVVGLVLKRW